MYQSWRKNLHLQRRYGQNSKIQDCGLRHLKFLKSVILVPSHPCIANIYLQTKYGANRSRNCWVHLFMYFQDGGHLPSWIVLPQFWTVPDVPVDGLNIPANGRYDPFGCDWDIAILRLCGFGWKMPRANFRQFCQILTHKIMMSLIWPPKICSYPRDTCFEILCVKISSVALYLL